jgi:hypothetical protein
VTSALFVVLLLLLFRALGRPHRSGRPGRLAPVPWAEPAHRLAHDVLRGVRTLSRLDAARRDRLGRPWA